MLLVAPSVLMLMMSISSAQRATPAARAAPDWEDEFKCARFVCECPSARLTAVQPVHCRPAPCIVARNRAPGVHSEYSVTDRSVCVCARAWPCGRYGLDEKKWGIELTQSGGGNGEPQ